MRLTIREIRFSITKQFPCKTCILYGSRNHRRTSYITHILVVNTSTSTAALQQITANRYTSYSLHDERNDLCSLLSYCPMSPVPGSVVGTATVYGLDGPGIESRWEAGFSAPVQTGPEAHTASCTMGTGSFPGVRCGRGVTLTPHPLLMPRSKIE